MVRLSKVREEEGSLCVLNVAIDFIKHVVKSSYTGNMMIKLQVGMIKVTKSC